MRLSSGLPRMWCWPLLSLSAALPTCTPEQPPANTPDEAVGIFGPLGEPLPTASAEQLATFARGREVFRARFDLGEGLGPAFNAVSCVSCHERPVLGGSAGLYRNFFLSGSTTADGAFLPGTSAGDSGGVIRVYRYEDGEMARPPIPDTSTVFAQRNSIPLFGVGLLAELPDEVILANEDPNDADGDGISGRANYDRAFVGRFGLKAQTVSIEGFIRGPLFNHFGVTSNPLTDQQKAALPVDSLALADLTGLGKQGPLAQAAAPEQPTVDNDGVSDPEMSSQELFDLVSFTMLLAAPQPEEPNEQALRGEQLFHQLQCGSCHVPALTGPRGAIPLYSDLLLHDMGEELADGIVMKLAGGSEFRTQPLWGITAVGPFLHDGRASTIGEAVLAHGGESRRSRDAFAALTEAQAEDVVEFLSSLGGRNQATTGLVPPEEPVPAVGDYGGPFRALTGNETARFLRGREVFDRDFGTSTGVGALTGPDGATRFNGDSCRACHFDPVIGGSGPRDVNVMRHGTINEDGSFTPPHRTPNTILHKQISVGSNPVEAEAGINHFEHRQTPHAFGIGLIDAIQDEVILANEDPDDADGDGVSGRAHFIERSNRVGRFGWKAQVPSVAEFVGDAMAAENGITLPAEAELLFAMTTDSDPTPDPELQLDEVDDIVFFLSSLAGPPRQSVRAELIGSVQLGESLFGSVGCAKCHIPSLSGSLGEVPLYSDLLLHDVAHSGAGGIADGMASMTEFRTAPLWGLSQTAPYWHSGEADTVDDAIRLHDGEAAGIRSTYESLGRLDREALLAFLASL